MRLLTASIIIPLVSFLVYCAGSIAVGTDPRHWYYREQYGPAEVGAVIAFLIAGILALRLAYRTWGRVPLLYSAFYICFGLAGILMAGEEASYGQHWLGFDTPDSIAHLNKQEEFNLHNLAGDRPSSIARRAAEIGFPVLLIVLPLLHLRFAPRSYEPKAINWPYWTLPCYEAIMATLLGNLCRPVGAWDPWDIQGVDEMAETLWGMATIFWIMAISARVMRDLGVKPADPTVIAPS